MVFKMQDQVPGAEWKIWLDKWFYWLLLGGIVVNATGLFLPVMEPDGCLYATISKTMVLTGDWINLKVEGKDWLDKPHFPFWITSVSFKLLGISGFAYKLPAFLFWMIGAGFIYIWGKDLYGRSTARLAVLIYVTVEHLILSNNDVRAEPYLTGLMIASAYCYYKVYLEKKWTYVLFGSIFLAAAIMTKGIFIAGIVASGFVIEWAAKKKWNEFTYPHWWAACFLVAVFILPELYCLYLQFDLHPEKLIFGQTGVSGIRFFFWDSQFGRFMNTGPIKGSGDPFFYTHTLLWAFVPWSVFPVLMLIATFSKDKKIINKTGSYISPAIFLTGFLLFSFSRFQLPHYLNILYPFLSLMVADYLVRLNNKRMMSFVFYTQQVIYFLLFVFCLVLFLVLGLKYFFIFFLTGIVLAFGFYRLFPGRSLQHIAGRTICAVLVANLFLNLIFYPELFNFQSGMQAARYLSSTRDERTVVTFADRIPEFALEFYSSAPVAHISHKDLDSLTADILMYGSEKTLDSLRGDGFEIREIQKFSHFHITRLTGTFINARTRQQAVDVSMLAVISPAKNKKY